MEISLHLVKCTPHVPIHVFEELLKLCYLIWKEADEKEKEKERLEENLYQYKPKTIDITMDEEKKEEKDTELMFPNYEKDFSSSFETTEELPLSQQALSQQALSQQALSVQTQFTDSQTKAIMDLHNQLYTNSNSLPPPISPLITAYRLAREIQSTINDKVTDLIVGHARACHLIIKSMVAKETK